MTGRVTPRLETERGRDRGEGRGAKGKSGVIVVAIVADVKVVVSTGLTVRPASVFLGNVDADQKNETSRQKVTPTLAPAGPTFVNVTLFISQLQILVCP